MKYIGQVITDIDVMDGLKERREQLGLTQEEMELDINLAHGHLGKIEHGDLSWGKRVIRMSQTFEWLLERLGLVLVLMDKESAQSLMGNQTRHRTRRHKNKVTKEIYPNKMQMRLRMTRRAVVKSTTCAAYLPEWTKCGSQLDPLLALSSRPKKQDTTETSSTKSSIAAPLQKIGPTNTDE